MSVAPHFGTALAIQLREATMTDQHRKRASDTPSSADTPSPQPPARSGQPDNENQYGGGRQVGMPREQNRDLSNPPKASRDPGPDDDGRVANSSGPDEGHDSSK